MRELYIKLYIKLIPCHIIIILSYEGMTMCTVCLLLVVLDLLLHCWRPKKVYCHLIN